MTKCLVEKLLEKICDIEVGTDRSIDIQDSFCDHGKRKFTLTYCHQNDGHVARVLETFDKLIPVESRRSNVTYVIDFKKKELVANLWNNSYPDDREDPTSVELNFKDISLIEDGLIEVYTDIVEEQEQEKAEADRRRAIRTRALRNVSSPGAFRRKNK